MDPGTGHSSEFSESPSKWSRDLTMDQGLLPATVMLEGPHDIGGDVVKADHAQGRSAQLTLKRVHLVAIAKIRNHEEPARLEHPGGFGDEPLHGRITVGGLDIDDPVESTGGERQRVGLCDRDRRGFFSEAPSADTHSPRRKINARTRRRIEIGMDVPEPTTTATADVEHVLATATRAIKQLVIHGDL